MRRGSLLLNSRGATTASAVSSERGGEVSLGVPDEGTTGVTSIPADTTSAIADTATGTSYI